MHLLKLQPHTYFSISFVLLLVITPITTIAAGFDEILWNIFIGIGGMFTWFGALALDYAITVLVIGMGEFLTSTVGDAVNNSWVIVRDICNILFIFSLIYIGLRTILKSDDSGTQRALGLLIVAALLINFSLLITKVVIDFTNIAAYQIHESVKINGEYDVVFLGSTSKGLAGAFLAEMRLGTFAEDSFLEKISSEEGLAGTGKIFVFGFLMMILMVVAGVVFLAGALILVKRFIVLIFFMIFSPLMFAGWIFPKFSDIQSKWWKGFLQNAFVAPAYILMLYISLYVAQGLNNTGSFAKAYDAQGGATGDFSIFLYYFVIAGFLVGSLVVAQKMGSATATATLNGLKATGNAARKNVQSYAGRNTIGAASRKLLEAYDRKGGKSRTFRNAFSAGADAKFGGKYSAQDDKKFSREVGQRLSTRDTRTGLVSSINASEAVKNDPDPTKRDRALIAMEEKLSQASASDLIELTKTKEGQEALKQVAGSIPQNKLDKIMEDTDTVTPQFKGELGAARGNSVKANLIGTVDKKYKQTDIEKPVEQQFKEGLRNASSDEIDALDFEKQILENAMQLQSSQMDDLKKKYGPEKYRILERKRKEQLVNTPIGTVVNSRKNKKEIAKLPNEILEGQPFINYVADEGKLDSDLLSKIASESNADKVKIGSLISKYYATAGPAAVPQGLKNYLDSPQGSQFSTKI